MLVLPPGSPENIKGHLPEHGVYGIFDHSCEPGPKGMKKYPLSAYTFLIGSLV